VRKWIPWALLVVLTNGAAVAATVGATSPRPPMTERTLLSPFYTPALEAPAIDAHTNTSYDTSCERSAQSQIALDECAGSELAQLRSHLHSALAFERQMGDRSLVNAAQSEFESYEKTECAEAAWPNMGGSIYPLVYANCEVNLTVQRIEQIRRDLLGVSGGRG
jgi:uncharacterized protein YecT (DUF1311 family)